MPGAWKADPLIAPADTKAECSDKTGLGEAAKGKTAPVPWSISGGGSGCDVAGVLRSTLDEEHARLAWRRGRHQLTVPLQLTEPARVRPWRAHAMAGQQEGCLAAL